MRTDMPEGAKYFGGGVLSRQHIEDGSSRDSLFDVSPHVFTQGGERSKRSIEVHNSRDDGSDEY